MRRYGPALGLAGLLVVLTAPAAPAAVTAAREGDLVTLRSDAGEATDLEVEVLGDGRARFYLRGVRPGPGCAAEGARPPRPGGGIPASADAVCDLAGVRAVRVELGDGADALRVSGSALPVEVDLGDGDDVAALGGRARPILVDAGPGDDRITGEVRAATIRLGPGDDEVRLGQAGALTAGPVRIDAGDGDDRLRLSLPATLSCGAGADLVELVHTAAPRLRPDGVRVTAGAGCPAHLDHPRPTPALVVGRLDRRSGKLLLDLGRVTRAGTLRLIVDPARGEGVSGAVVETTVRVRAGRARLSVRPAPRAARVLRRRGRLQVTVLAVLRAPGSRDVEETLFGARLRG